MWSNSSVTRLCLIRSSSFASGYCLDPSAQIVQDTYGESEHHGAFHADVRTVCNAMVHIPECLVKGSKLELRQLLPKLETACTAERICEHVCVCVRHVAREQCS